jgi:predicted enzyme related to lactoylglutathione lyase
VTLSPINVLPDTTGTISSGQSATVTTTTAGQNAKLTFSATAGQWISLVGTNGMTGQVLGCDVNATIIAPDTTPVTGASACMEQSGFIDAVQLPATGTYTILVDPVSAATGSLTLALYTVTDLTGTVTINGSAAPFTTTTPGQNMDVTFTGAALQTVRGSTTTPGSSVCATLKIVRQDMTTLVSSYTGCGSTITMPAVSLPAGETYHLIVDPSGTSIGTFNVSVISP